MIDRHLFMPTFCLFIVFSFVIMVIVVVSFNFSALRFLHFVLRFFKILMQRLNYNDPQCLNPQLITRKIWIYVPSCYINKHAQNLIKYTMLQLLVIDFCYLYVPQLKFFLNIILIYIQYSSCISLKYSHFLNRTFQMLSCLSFGKNAQCVLYS